MIEERENASKEDKVDDMAVDTAVEMLSKRKDWIGIKSLHFFPVNFGEESMELLIG
jgi:hypothetical protein